MRTVFTSLLACSLCAGAAAAQQALPDANSMIAMQLGQLEIARANSVAEIAQLRHDIDVAKQQLDAANKQIAELKAAKPTPTPD